MNFDKSHACAIGVVVIGVKFDHWDVTVMFELKSRKVCDAMTLLYQ